MTHDFLPILSRSLLVTLALLAAPAAQVRFDSHDGSHLRTIAIGVPLEANGFETADVDGDGYPDLLIALNSTGCRICFNDGSGSFRAFVDTGAYGTRQVACGDVDGDLDLLCGGGRIAYGGPTQIALSLNQGNRTFATSFRRPTVAVEASKIALTDIDGDSDLDAVIVSSQPGAGPAVQVWANDGTGGFTDVTATAIAVQPNGAAAAVVDLDGDGFTDLVLDQGGTNLWLRGDGTGVFAAAAAAGLGSGFRLARDFDGDGDLDLLNAGDLRLNDGGAVSFTPVASVQIPADWSVVAADFDGDGQLDLAGTEGDTRPYLWLDRGGFVFQDVSDAWFDPHVRVDRTIGYHFAFSAAFDCDGDGDPDLVTGGTEGRSGSSTTVGVPPRVHLNDRDAHRLRDATRPAMAFLQIPVQDCQAADLDGDHDLDLVLEGKYVCRQDDQDTFTETELAPNRPTGAARLADFDGDGDVDLLTLSTVLFQPAQPELWLNDGRGSFARAAPGQLPAVSLWGRALATATSTAMVISTPSWARSTPRTRPPRWCCGRTTATAPSPTRRRRSRSWSSPTRWSWPTSTAMATSIF